MIGVDRAKMRLYDCEQQAQDDLLDSGQEDIMMKMKNQRNLLLSLSFKLNVWRLTTHTNAQYNQNDALINSMTKQVDFSKYAIFVDGVTSDPSKDYQSFLESLEYPLTEKVPIFSGFLLLLLALVLKVVSLWRSLRRWYSKVNLGQMIIESILLLSWVTLCGT